MPKVNHGPEPKAAPPSLVVMLQRHRTLADPLIRYADFQSCIDRAEVLEERLVVLHDAVEFAIGKLNNVTAADDGTFADSDALHEALAQLNKVL